MRGIAVVVVTTFIAMIMFGLVAPAALEPIMDVVTSNQAVQDSVIDGAGLADGLRNAIFVWGPLITVGFGVVWAVRYYLRRELLTGRVR